MNWLPITDRLTIRILDNKLYKQYVWLTRIHNNGVNTRKILNRRPYRINFIETRKNNV